MTAPLTIPCAPPAHDDDAGLFRAPLGPTVGTPPAPRTTREGEDLPVAYPDGPVPLCSSCAYDARVCVICGGESYSCACTRRANAKTADFCCSECGCEFSDQPMLSPVMCRACRGDS